METIYFDDNNKIIGFNSNNSLYYVNLYNINNIQKSIAYTSYTQAKDELGRLLFYKMENNKQIITHDSNDEKLLIPKTINKNIYLINNSEEFTLQDIIQEKYNQLINNFGCKDCMLDELYNSNLFKFNGMVNNNFIRIINKNITSGIINIPDSYNEIAIYVESTNNVSIDYSYDNINYININANEFIKLSSKQITIQLNSDIPIDINCFAILLK